MVEYKICDWEVVRSSLKTNPTRSKQPEQHVCLGQPAWKLLSYIGQRPSVVDGGGGMSACCNVHRSLESQQVSKTLTFTSACNSFTSGYEKANKQLQIKCNSITGIYEKATTIDQHEWEKMTWSDASCERRVTRSVHGVSARCSEASASSTALLTLATAALYASRSAVRPLIADATSDNCQHSHGLCSVRL